MDTQECVPLVDYLRLGDEPHLVTHECVACEAKFFDRRMACASCFGDTFRLARVPTVGILTTFTVVSVAAPGVPVPFVAGIVDCGGVSVRTNIINVDPDPAALRLGMALRLATYPIGKDVAGVTAIAFGFEPHGEGNG